MSAIILLLLAIPMAIIMGLVLMVLPDFVSGTYGTGPVVLRISGRAVSIAKIPRCILADGQRIPARILRRLLAMLHMCVFLRCRVRVGLQLRYLLRQSCYFCIQLLVFLDQANLLPLQEALAKLEHLQLSLHTLHPRPHAIATVMRMAVVGESAEVVDF